MKTNFIHRVGPDGFTHARGTCPHLNYNEDLLDRTKYLVSLASADELHTGILNGEFTEISTTEELKRVFSDILMRFDNSPNLYVKADYLTLIGAICQGLMHAYDLKIESGNPDALTVEKDEIGIFTLTPEIGELLPENGEGLPENNSKKLTTVEGVQNFVNEKLTWLEI